MSDIRKLDCPVSEQEMQELMDGSRDSVTFHFGDVQVDVTLEDMSDDEE